MWDQSLHKYIYSSAIASPSMKTSYSFFFWPLILLVETVANAFVERFPPFFFAFSFPPFKFIHNESSLSEEVNETNIR